MTRSPNPKRLTAINPTAPTAATPTPAASIGTDTLFSS